MDMETKNIYIRSRGNKIALTAFYKDKDMLNSLKEKPCIFFLPGTMANPYTYWNFVEEMVKYDVVVVGLHYIGHGLADRVDKFNFSDLKQNAIDGFKYVKDNLSLFGTDIIIFGHSQGGILASSLIGLNLTKKYILGNLIISNQKDVKDLIGLSKVPSFLIPFVRIYLKILGKIKGSKKLKFGDYVKAAEDESDEENIGEDPLKIDEYPLSMVTSLININTKNLTRPKREIQEEIFVFAGTNDPIFPLKLQKEAFNLIKAKNKHFIQFDTDKHMMYTEHPKELCELIYKEVIDGKEY